MSPAARAPQPPVYHDRIVTVFTACSVAWALLGMIVGVYVAAELVWPGLGFSEPWLSFGRLRTVHTNVVLFGFGVSALIGTSFYSVQRTSHVPRKPTRSTASCATLSQVASSASSEQLENPGWQPRVQTPSMQLRPGPQPSSQVRRKCVSPPTAASPPTSAPQLASNAAPSTAAPERPA